MEVRRVASKRIQGITVEIGGDTSKLTAALKDVDRSLSTTQGNLRDINKLLKLDPGNTELLAQKHRLLGDAVKETKERLETLKNAAQQANEALARGDITQNQYDALKREIIDTEQKLKNLENQANQSSVAIQKIGLAGSNLQSLGNSISNVGSSLMPISATVTGIGVAGLKVATDFEKAMSGVQAITGATGEEFEALRNTAIDLGATTAFSSASSTPTSCATSTRSPAANKMASMALCNSICSIFVISLHHSSILIQQTDIWVFTGSIVAKGNRIRFT
jgi:phage-related minor tail protein